MGVRKKLLFGLLITTFILINIYIAFHLYEQFTEFKLKNFPIHISVLRQNQPAYLNITDINNDNTNEVVSTGYFYYPGKKSFQIFEPYEYFYNFPFFFDITIPENYKFIDAYYSSKYKDFVCRFLSHDEKNEMIIKTIDNRHNTLEITRLENPGFRYPGRGGAISKLDVLDINKDNKEELIIVYRSYYINEPRGVVCFDPVSGKKIWSFRTGTQVEDVIFEDFDGDGKKEIILSSFACNNGSVANGTSDDKSYVIVLDSNGKLIWKKITGEWYTRVNVNVCNTKGDGNFEIIAGVENHRGGSNFRGKIFIFDALTGGLIKEKIEKNVSFSGPVVRKKEEKDAYIYVGDSLGSIRRFSTDLNELDKTKPLNKPMKVLDSFKNFQYLNYIFAVTQDELLAYNLKLENKILHYEFKNNSDKDGIVFSSALNFFNLNGKKNTNAVLKADKLYMLSDKRPKLTHLMRDLFDSGLLFSLFALILFNISAVVAYRKTIRSSKIPEKSDARETLAMVQELTHQVKTPVSTVLWTAEKMKRNIKKLKQEKNRKDFSQLADFLMDDVKDLKQYTKNIMQLLRIQNPEFQKIYLSQFIHKITHPYKNLLDEKIEFEMDIDENIVLWVDKDLFKELIVNLIENSIDAIEDSGKIQISATPVHSPFRGVLKEVILEIEDTGTGMSKEDAEKAFSPFFTKKREGSGLGLSICKRIAEVHSGKIKIFSKEKFGTKVEVIIPALKREESG